VPIGAGLDKLPKKKKRRAKRYVEPGSSRGLLTFVFLGLVGFGSWKYQPWKDDWDLVRGWFGQGKHHSLIGEWEVVKTVAVKQDQAWVAQENIQRGTVKFSDKGSVKIDLFHPQSETVANGKFKQDGVKVAMRDLRTSGEAGTSIPTVIDMRLAWTGENTVVAMDKSQAIYLKRKKKSGGGLLSFMQFRARKDAKPDDGQVPDAMRGVIGNMKRAASEAESTGDTPSSKDN